jgi:histidine triad (HIT) family protein
MYNHEPAGYNCPFCEYIKDNSEYIVYSDNFLTAFISTAVWNSNIGSVLIIPNKHVENLYDMPDDLLEKIAVLSKRVALAIKENYKSDAVSLRQHNEPDGNQSVWHYHQQVIPRWKDDNFYGNHSKDKREISPEERLEYAKLIKAALK